jgi:hypothetical protein
VRVTDQQASRRHAASVVPEITGVRLTPVGGHATLVNISSSGVLVECGTSVAPKMAVTVSFEGSFTPAYVDGHVARCVVVGIGKDSALRYHIGIAFDHMILLDAERDHAEGDPLPAIPPSSPGAPRPAAPPEVRNRW